MGDHEGGRTHASMLADAVIEILAKRYGINAQEVMDSLTWIREHREFVSSLKRGGLLSMLSLLITAGAIAIWEGLKSLMHK